MNRTRLFRSALPLCWPMAAALLLMGLLAAAQPAPPPAVGEDRDRANLPSDLALVPQDDPAFISVRVADLLASKPGKQFRQDLGKEAETVTVDLHRELGVALDEVERLTVLPGRRVLIVRTVSPYDRDKLLEALAPNAQRVQYHGQTGYEDRQTRTGLFLAGERVFLKCWDLDRTASGREESSLGQLLALLDRKQPALSEALALAAEKHDLVVGFRPAVVLPLWLSDALAGAERTSAETLADGVPPELWPYQPLLRAHSASLVLDLGDELTAQARLTFPNEELVGDGETAARMSLYVLRQALSQNFLHQNQDPEVGKKVVPLVQRAQAALKSATVKTEGSVVTVSGRLAVDEAALAGAVLRVRRSVERLQSANNLRQLGLALLNYLDAYGSMPPAAICSKDGKPLLSWRVAILPFIEQDNLYKQFHLDEPWDSPNNKPLLEKMPRVFAPVRGGTKEPFATYYQVFVGPHTPFNQPPDRSLPLGAQGPRVVDFLDGTSNTLLIVEAGEPVPWTKPADIVYDEKKPVPRLGQFGHGFAAAMADGSVHFVQEGVDEQTLRNLIDPADGNVIDWSRWTGNAEGAGGRSRTTPAASVQVEQPTRGGAATPPPLSQPDPAPRPSTSPPEAPRPRQP